MSGIAIRAKGREVLPLIQRDSDDSPPERVIRWPITGNDSHQKRDMKDFIQRKEYSNRTDPDVGLHFCKSVAKRNIGLVGWIGFWWLAKLWYNVQLKEWYTYSRTRMNTFSSSVTDVAFIATFAQYFICATALSIYIYGSKSKLDIKAMLTTLTTLPMMRNIFVLCVCDGVSVFCVNLALSESGVTCTHVVKSLEPIFQSIITFFMFANSTEKQSNRLAIHSYVAIVALCAGVVLSTFHNAAFRTKPIILVLCACVGTQMRVAMAKKIQSTIGGLYKPEYLLCAMAMCNSVLLSLSLGLTFPLFDRNIIADIYTLRSSSISISSLLMCALLYVCYQLGSFNTLTRVSNPIYHSVANVCSRVVVVIIGGAIVLRDTAQFHSYNIGGVMLALISTIAFVVTKNQRYSVSRSTSVIIVILVSLSLAIIGIISVVGVNVNSGSVSVIDSGKNRTNINDPFSAAIKVARIDCIKDVQTRIQTILEPTVSPIVSNRDEYCVSMGEYPLYDNHGDTLLYLGEQKYFRNLGIYPNAFMYYDDKQLSNACIDDSNKKWKTVHFFQAGGNWNCIWPMLQSWRENVTQKYFDNIDKFVVFPQTVYYSDADMKSPKFEKTTAFWTKYGSKFLIMVRSEESVTFLEKIGIPSENIAVSPDIAFLTGMQFQLSKAANGDSVADGSIDIKVLSRSDKEKRTEIPKLNSHQSFFIVNGQNLSISISDWEYDSKAYYQQWKSSITQKMGQLSKLSAEERLYLSTLVETYSNARKDEMLNTISKGKVVITDRLHASISAILTGKPLIYLSEQTNKIAAQMKIIRDTSQNCQFFVDNGVTKAQSFEDALAIAQQWLN